jgi:FtsP/CotA-like multicopper oxidase with cupredoxin domain
MTTTSLPRLRRVFTVALALLVMLAVGVVPVQSSAHAGTSEGLRCDYGTASSQAVPTARTFSLTATSGYIQTPDGNTIFMWGYAGPSGQFQLPGPTLCANQGDTVTVSLRNLLGEPVSAVFPGQTGVTANGVPAQPVFDSSNTMTSMVQAAAKGATVTYSFVASRPGTFLYESGTDVAKQVQMGLYGALVVRPVDANGNVMADHAYNSDDSRFSPGHEYIHLLSEVDPALHQAVERGRVYDPTKYRARYFLINGRSMPDTLAPNNAAWLPNQPYGATIHIQPKSATNPDPALIRYLSVGLDIYPFHPHGNDQNVIARDGFPLVDTGGGQANRSYEKYLIDIGPGQTVDTTLYWTDSEAWNPTDNPIPVDLPPLQDQIVTPDTWFSESPYLGYLGDLPPNVTSNNQCGEYYHVAHSHALQQATNYGATFGGMMTLIRIDPPSPNTCPSAP